MKKIRLVIAVSVMALMLHGFVQGADLSTDNIKAQGNVTVYGSISMTSVPADGNTNGLVLFYKFVTNSTPVVDDSGKGNSGTVNGATWTASGKTNGAYSFDGSDDNIRVTTPVGLPLGNSNRTIIAWFKTTYGSQESIVSYGGTSANATFGLNVNNGKLEFSGWGNDFSGTSTVNNNQWHMGAVVQSSTSGRTLYVDGVAETSDFDSIATTTGSLYVGRWTTVWGLFSGTIDEVRIYNRALTGVEISGIFNYYSPTGGTNTNRSMSVKGSIRASGQVSASRFSVTNEMTDLDMGSFKSGQ